MVDVLNLYSVPPPYPPPSSSPPKPNMPMLYYGLVVLGTAALVLAIYNLIIIRRCSRRRMQPQPAGTGRPQVEVLTSRSTFHENPNRNYLSSFKYKKEEQKGSVQGHEELLEGTVEYECPVCLSVFEEGEEVRKLPRCKHCFHVICIDMWLYSHFDCPVCRTPVGPFCQRIPENNNDTPAENSREGLLESGTFVWLWGLGRWQEKEGVGRKEAGPLDGASPGVVLDLALVNWNINVDPIFLFIVLPTIYLLNTGHSIWSTCVCICVYLGTFFFPPKF